MALTGMNRLCNVDRKSVKCDPKEEEEFTI
jgi:hypothetical protein